MTPASTVLVYRVENSHQTGPYNPPYWAATEAQALLADVLCDVHSRNDSHPGPRQDRQFQRHTRGYEFGEQHVFGFLSRADMVEWFEGFGASLEDADYMVNLYRVPVDGTISGCNQVAYDRREAICVGTFRPTLLIKDGENN